MKKFTEYIDPELFAILFILTGMGIVFLVALTILVVPEVIEAFKCGI